MIEQVAKEGLEKALKTIADKVPDFSNTFRGREEKEPIFGGGGKIPDFSTTITRGFTSESDGLVKNLPVSNGEWKGDVGNSTWCPNDGYTPQKHNPDNLTWAEIKEKFGIEGIEFKDGEPNFSTISEASVGVVDFSTDRKLNFMQADEQLAEKWTQEAKDGKEWTPSDVAEYRKANGLSWHERSDQKIMDLVPSLVHGNVPHSGGISAAKQGV
ncbi:HNH endonuclease [Hydrogenovibrio thermophilus]|uniref:HNH endonuclease n=1 Tax=Hydrogenovibrio thermophilus TaxID=265883 RepID=A0A451G543_9GAMM|nr:HNH endonuclease [Hydrogenovibrio thermophilus]QAB14616.1 hypothetical protein EPV75_02505 [Hydrogenovibrio thermophilus]